MAAASEAAIDVSRAARESVPELPSELYQETLLSLAEDGYVDGMVTTTANGRSTVVLTRLLPKGRRAVGQWPGDEPAKEVLDAIDRLESEEVDPEKKGKLSRLRSGIEDAGTDLVAKVIVEAFRVLGGRAI